MRFYSILVILFSFSLSLQAQTLDDLVKLLAFNTFQADFKQNTLEADGTVLQQLEGKLVFAKPNQFYWQSYAPYAQKLVGNGEKIWHFDEDLEQVVLQNYAEQANQTPMLLLLKDTEALKTGFTLVSSEKKAKLSVFTLKPTEENAQLENIQVGFVDKKLHLLRFTDNLKQTTNIVFEHVELNPQIPAKQFEFTVPEGTDIIYE